MKILTYSLLTMFLSDFPKHTVYLAAHQCTEHIPSPYKCPSTISIMQYPRFPVDFYISMNEYL